MVQSSILVERKSQRSAKTRRGVQGVCSAYVAVASPACMLLAYSFLNLAGIVTCVADPSKAGPSTKSRSIR